MTREILRHRSAQYLNSIPNETLFQKFGITRVAELTKLDTVGYPVYSVTRPLGQTVSVNAGKGLDNFQARAGAVAEGVEFHTFENPPRRRGWVKEVHAYQLPLAGLLPWARGAKVTDKFRVELVTKFSTHAPVFFPSDLVWLSERRAAPSGLFQQTSNGQAVGPCQDDALLAGIYEVVERDAISVWTHIWDALKTSPPLVDLEKVPGSVKEIVNRIERSALKVLLYYCTIDIPFPVFWAVILDPYGGLAPFAGWGSAIVAEQAAIRALLEALQARCVYISGARDDVFRRNFEQLQSLDQVELLRDIEKKEKTEIVFDQVFYKPAGVQEELNLALNRLGRWIENLYFKRIDLPDDMVAVKTIILGLEPPHNPLWHPSVRCYDLASRA